MAYNMKVNSSKHLGNALRTVRKSRKMTQAALAERAGIRQATVSDIENGLTSTTKVLLKILNALGAKLELHITDIGVKPFDPERDIESLQDRGEVSEA